MHIADGILSAPVIAAGTAAAAAGTGLGLHMLDEEEIPKTAVLSCGFFVASLIHVPVGLSSSHLILNGVAGIILGWAVFPALLIALFMQWLFFSFGGITSLGVNTVAMALPGVLCHYLLRRPVRSASPRIAFIAGTAAGALSIGLSALLLASALLLSGKDFTLAAATLLAAHLPVLVVEGIVTGSIIVFFRNVRPEILAAYRSSASGGRQLEACSAMRTSRSLK